MRHLGWVLCLAIGLAGCGQEPDETEPLTPAGSEVVRQPIMGTNVVCSCTDDCHNCNCSVKANGTACSTGNCCTGTCWDETSATTHCGGCNTNCNTLVQHLAASTAWCNSSSCDYTGSCASGYSDCDSNRANGCEIQTGGSDVNNCGGCNINGYVCQANGGTNPCVSGVCTPSCDTTHLNCNSYIYDGCESSLSTTKCTQGANGTCTGCPANPPNGSYACTSKGTCTLACNTNYSICSSTTCKNLQTDAANCGTCGTVCTPLNGTNPCTTGACAPACDTTHLDCDSSANNGCEAALSPTNCTQGANSTCGGCPANPSNGSYSCSSKGVCTLGCNTNYSVCGSSCVNLLTDAANCGGCGTVCNAVNGSNVCTGGVCVPACNTTHLDCDSQPNNGCEAGLTSSTCTQAASSTCTGCPANPPNGNGYTCTSKGTCTLACQASYSVCSGNSCKNLQTDTSNCGTCGTVCTAQNGTNPCTTGACAPACDTTHLDCDGNKNNGCEAGLSITNCTQAASSTCTGCPSNPANGAGYTCTSKGTCTLACVSNYTVCGGNTCKDLQTDAANCGSCGNGCGGGNICSAGNCCPAGQTWCAGQGLCKDLQGDSNNCGVCGTVCSTAGTSSTSCVTGTCTPVCDSTHFSCNANSVNDGCETATSPGSNCTACGTGCGSLPANATSWSCTSKTCVVNCSGGFTPCSGATTCKNLQTDSANCGACGTVCSAAGTSSTSCVATVCTPVCDSTHFNCDTDAVNNDGCEVATSPGGSCTSCGASCGALPPNAASFSCTNKSCVVNCSATYSNCSGSCFNLNTDASHCGGCNGKVCSSQHIASPTCAAAICNGACDTDYADCNTDKLSDGCEVNLKTDANNCGVCGTICQQVGGSNVCINGTCVPSCDGAHQDCDGNPKNGCESTKASDANNCNACGVKCLATGATSTSCITGVCTPVCDGTHQDCDSNHVNGCESTKASDNGNCGACGVICQSNGGSNSCSSSNCVPVCDGLHQNCDGNPNNGCESTKASDDNNCGSCGVVCLQDGGGGINACGAGVCVPKCDLTHSDCDSNTLNGCETVSTLDNCGGNNCAKCDDVQSNRTACASNVCTYSSCKAGFLDCDTAGANTNGCETTENALHCGSSCVTCAQPPNTTAAACINHLCGYLACTAGHADCDATISTGCEIDIANDINNCGGCGHVCPTPAYGAAVCSSGLCGAVCILDASVPLKQCVTDGGAINCGQCCDDTDCASPPDLCHENPGACTNGFCVYALKACTRVDCFSEPVCNLNSGNCDSTPQNGGSCGGTGCYVGGVTGTCKAGTCVDSSNNPLQLINCSQNVPVCKVGVCNRVGMCDTVDAPNGAACTTSDLCQVNPTCQGGSCMGSAKSCTPSAQCRVTNCNGKSGNCDEQIAQAGTACSTGDPCRVTELCDAAGNCVGRPKADGNPCNLSDCTSGGICLSGSCLCADSLDMSMSENVQDSGIPADMTKGHDASGCSYGGGGPAGALIVLLTLFALALRRRRT